MSDKTPKQLRDPRTFRVLGDAIYIMPDDSELARVLAGENIPLEERRINRYLAGETVKGVPTVSAGWMLEDGLIEVADEKTAPKTEAVAVAPVRAPVAKPVLVGGDE